MSQTVTESRSEAQPGGGGRPPRGAGVRSADPGCRRTQLSVKTLMVVTVTARAAGSEGGPAGRAAARRAPRASEVTAAGLGPHKLAGGLPPADWGIY